MEGDSIWVLSYTDLTIRLLIAALLGGLIGWERERNNHPAGLRTHMLVCIGATLIMLLSIYGFPQFMNQSQVRFDPGRIAAQVVSGIGFLGAGTILRQGFTVSGLTTAASLWVVAAIGLSAGAGFYYPAVLTTALALVSLELLNRLEGWLFRKKRVKVFRVHVVDQPGKLGELATRFGMIGASVRKVQMDEGDEEEQIVEISFTVKIPQTVPVEKVMDQIQDVEGVKEVNVD